MIQTSSATTFECDRCGKTQVNYDSGSTQLPAGWLLVVARLRGTHLCPTCVAGFDAWLGGVA
jgi:hypothetical protein